MSWMLPKPFGAINCAHARGETTQRSLMLEPEAFREINGLFVVDNREARSSHQLADWAHLNSIFARKAPNRSGMTGRSSEQGLVVIAARNLEKPVIERAGRASEGDAV